MFPTFKKVRLFPAKAILLQGISRISDPRSDLFSILFNLWDKLQDRQKQSAAFFSSRKSPPCNLEKKHTWTPKLTFALAPISHILFFTQVGGSAWVCGGGIKQGVGFCLLSQSVRAGLRPLFSQFVFSGKRRRRERI